MSRDEDVVSIAEKAQNLFSDLSDLNGVEIQILMP